MHTDDGTLSSFNVEPQPVQGENIQLPIYVLPQGYTPLFANATNERLFIQQPMTISVVTEARHVGFQHIKVPLRILISYSTALIPKIPILR